MDKKGRIIYRKLFVVYTAVIILLIALLDLYFLKYSMDLTKDNKMYANQHSLGKNNYGEKGAGP